MKFSGRDALATALPLLRYFTKPGKPEKITQTVWVTGDLNHKASRELLRNAITFMVCIFYLKKYAVSREDKFIFVLILLIIFLSLHS